MAEPLRLLFLGRLAPLAGGRERAWPLAAPQPLGDLIAALTAEAPDLAAALAHPSVRVAVNQAIAPGRAGIVRPGDEVAFLPPVSGG